MHARAKRGKKGQSLLPISSNTGTLPGKPSFSMHNRSSGRQALKTHKHPPLSPFCLTLYIGADVICYGISLGLIWVSWPGCVPSQDLAHCHPLWRGEGTSEGHCCLAVGKILLHYQPDLSSYQCKAQLVRDVNFTLVRASTPPKIDNHDSPTLAGRVSWTTGFSEVQIR